MDLYYHFSMTQSPPIDSPSSIEDLEFSYELRIPKERVAVLIGKKGSVKKSLEAHTKTTISIDSKEGEVRITGKDSLSLFCLKEVILAIGRGFNPDIAQLLLKQDYVLEVIYLSEYAKNKNHLIRLRGRVIGAEGKARSIIERLTETYITVYGKTVAIIGSNERAVLARRAMNSLIEGSPHANVYKWLEKTRKELRRKEAFNL